MHSFTQIETNIGVGTPPPGWRSIVDCNLWIIVGVTGVGKSTTIETLQQIGAQFALLPNRRLLTDRLMIERLQSEDGDPLQPVRDRMKRFGYTRRYRERFHGGMAHALAQLQIGSGLARKQLVFDGLRGVNEVEHAIYLFPLAHFVVLHAPDLVRVERLLQRKDRFDSVEFQQKVDQDKTNQQTISRDPYTVLDVDDASTVFEPSEVVNLLTLVQTNRVELAELRSKIRIVVEERRNYDPNATLATLLRDAADRTIAVDTTIQTPTQIATSIADAMKLT
ncbi:AAA family ATPase [Chloroflexi bacterium TSY]|nr:AAA family ATPase [Chloroflexi bacterium TSY]